MGWACVHTYVSEERKATRNLTDQEYDAFCPLRIVPNPKKVTEGMGVPLFPGYVFVSLDDDAEWGPINNTPGVIRLLTERMRRPSWRAIQSDLIGIPRPLYLPDGFVERLRLLEEEYGGLAPDTVVRVIWADNPLKGITGTVVSLTKDERVLVMYTLLNRPHISKFEPRHLEIVVRE